MGYTALLVAASRGRVLCVAPTNVATDNFAERIVKIDVEVVQKRNTIAGDRIRQKLVVRGYKLMEEEMAFRNALGKPGNLDGATPSIKWVLQARWRPRFSVAYWLLTAFRSPDVPQLTEDSPQFLHDLRASIDSRDDLRDLRELATQSITLAEFQKRGTQDAAKTVFKLLLTIVHGADILCVTPALSDTDYKVWRETYARALIADEAANLNRADLACAWGNTLLPCILGGDPKQ